MEHTLQEQLLDFYEDDTVLHLSQDDLETFSFQVEEY